MARAQVGLSA